MRRSTWERRRGGEEERRRGNGKKKIRKKMRVNHRLWRDVARSRAEKQTEQKINQKKLTVFSIKLLPAKSKSRFLNQSGKYRCRMTMLSGGIESEKYQAYLVLSFIVSSLLPTVVSVLSRSITRAASIKLEVVFVMNE